MPDGELTPDAILQLGLHRWDADFPMPEHRADGGPCELLEGDRGSHRISRQPDERAVVDPAKRQRLAGADA